MTSKISIFVHNFSNCIAILCYLDKNVSFHSFIKERNDVKHLFNLSDNLKSYGDVKLECKLKQNKFFQLMKFVHS